MKAFTKFIGALAILAVSAGGCVARTAAYEYPDIGPTRGIWARDAVRPAECPEDEPAHSMLEVACNEMISLADPLDHAGTLERSARPALRLTEDARLVYADEGRLIGRGETVYSAGRGLELDLAADGWRRVSRSPDGHEMTWLIERPWGTVRAALSLSQLGTPTRDGSIIGVRALMETLGPVSGGPYHP